MKAFRAVFSRIADALIQRARRRDPDFVVGGQTTPYLRRWWLIPRNPVFNVYLHQFLRDDDDRALHDHPWFWCSILLRGGYVEHTAGWFAGRWAPSIKLSSPWRAHRIELFGPEETSRTPAWTLFVTGPRLREWGFHCPGRGWVHWRDFTRADDPGSVGRGCDQ